jgi:osmoprotectant transport system permease protein
MTPGEPLIRWDWVLSHLGDIGQRLGEHLLLTAIAVGVGLVLSFLPGIWIARHPRYYGPVVGFAGVLYTIPSLALFALLVPVTGLSLLTAEIGLVSYTLLFLIRNVVEGLNAVPTDVREAALGMGYTSHELLWRVEVPLALPAILAGVRIATVSTIGLTTVTALIGQGGLGAFILEGLQRFFSTPLVVGAVLSVALAIVADGVLVLLGRWVTPWTRRGR